MTRGSTGCLVIHGFAGNAGDVAPLADFLSERGYPVACPAISGHTGNRADLARSGHKEWIESVEEHLKMLLLRHEHAAVIGFSMGGLIAVNLAAKYSVSCLVSLNTPALCPNPRMAALNVVKDLRTLDFRNIRRYIGGMTSIPPVAPMVSFRALVRLTKPLFGKVTCPIFIGQSLQDDVVPKGSAAFICENVASDVRTLRYYANSGHVICHEEDRSAVFCDIVTFIGSCSFTQGQSNCTM